MKRIIMLPLLSILLAGCPSAPTRQDVQSHNYGERPIDDVAHKAIVAHMSDNLIDPGSATYKCGSPKKGSAWSCNHNGLGNGCGTSLGYIVACRINAKNKFGGYTGAKDYYFMIKGDPKSPYAYNLEIDPHWVNIYE